MSKKAIGAGVCSALAIMGVMYANFGSEIRLSPQGAEIMGNAEGCRRDPYRCPADVLTVGIGSTALGGEPIIAGKRYSDEEIAERWKNDIVKAEQCVNRWANGDKLPQSVFDSATSFTFNVGCGKARNSTFFRHLYLGSYKQACYELPKWVYAGGRKLPGLVSRREQEKRLCLQDLN